jgi:nitrate/TMAO reductase-like tetraheme cytochrome c subunit
MVYILLGFIALCIALLILVMARPDMTAARGGKMLAFAVIFVLPLLAGSMGVTEHMERSKETHFCLSCHIMEPYGRSLYVDSKEAVPAAHFQYARIPRDHACFTCHTTYTMFGDYAAKMRGLRHVWVSYLGKPPKPEDIKLYTPYNNRECLHCHDGARSFEENNVHKDGDTMAQIKSGKQSCVDAGCHDVTHNVKDLKEQKFWKAHP